jgi:hypothetical protein
MQNVKIKSMKNGVFFAVFGILGGFWQVCPQFAFPKCHMNCLDKPYSMVPIALGTDLPKPPQNAKNCKKNTIFHTFYFDILHVCQQEAQRAPIAMGLKAP